MRNLGGLGTLGLFAVERRASVGFRKVGCATVGCGLHWVFMVCNDAFLWVPGKWDAYHWRAGSAGYFECGTRSFRGFQESGMRNLGGLEMMGYYVVQ